MTSSASAAPYLSVVAASRNDDHGGDPLIRTQLFIDCFARQCEKYRLPAELILVDWNPVAGRPGLAGVLQLPTGATYCTGRVITVPAELHDRYKYAEKLPFFQMIAKNAGIRRARGKFVLATNIDIIFSDELMSHIGRQQLDPTKMLRVDRYDIQRDIPAGYTVDQILDYAWAHPVRSNRRLGLTPLREHLYGEDWFKRTCVPDPAVCANIEQASVVREADGWSVRPHRDRPIDDLHTNACGDFTLLPAEGWNAITGYAEFAAYSMNIDSLGLAAAHYAGYQEVALLPPHVCFHIEHSLGSGWTPEGEQKLFARLKAAKILNPDWEVLHPLIEAMRRSELSPALNGPDWGLVRFNLPEAPLLAGRKEAGPLHPQPFHAPDLPVSSIPPEFDLDYLTLLQTRISERANKLLADCRADRRHLEAYIQSVDKDRSERMTAIEQLQGGIANLTERVDRCQAYIAEIEKDRTARLETIQFYEGKLKQAYADHEHNVGYIDYLHKELAAHQAGAAARDAVNAQLNEQLRQALEKR